MDDGGMGDKGMDGPNETAEGFWELRLYIAGQTPKSVAAFSNLKKICEEHLRGKYDLEVIDIYQQPDLASSEQIIAAPTLVKKLPPPLRKFIGGLSETEKVLVGLDIKKEKTKA